MRVGKDFLSKLHKKLKFETASKLKSQRNNEIIRVKPEQLNTVGNDIMECKYQLIPKTYNSRLLV